jgi:hypothetical protein
MAVKSRSPDLVEILNLQVTVTDVASIRDFKSVVNSVTPWCFPVLLTQLSKLN